MDAFVIIIFLFISLWSITKTLEKLTNKILEKQDNQINLLQEIKAGLTNPKELIIIYIRVITRGIEHGITDHKTRAIGSRCIRCT